MKNKLTGKWQFVCLKINPPEGWECLKNFSDGQFVWNFQSDGMLVECIGGKTPSVVKYLYNPSENLLSIDCSGYAGDGFLRDCTEKYYRVEFPGGRYMILYDLEDVEAEPDDYAIRMELENCD